MFLDRQAANPLSPRTLTPSCHNLCSYSRIHSNACLLMNTDTKKHCSSIHTNRDNGVACIIEGNLFGTTQDNLTGVLSIFPDITHLILRHIHTRQFYSDFITKLSVRQQELVYCLCSRYIPFSYNRIVIMRFWIKQKAE